MKSNKSFAISRTLILVIVAAVVVVAGVAAFFLAQPGAKSFNVTARDFGFDGFTGPGPTIRVKVGDTVQINLENKGGLKHELVISSSNMVQQTLFNANTGLIDPGQRTTITFVANQAGNFFYVCFSDDGVAPKTHAELGMWGEFIVEG